jgi:hypothetical protein
MFLDEVLKRLNIIDQQRYYPVKKLYQVLYELGLITMTEHTFSANWWGLRIRTGKIVMPEQPRFAKWKITYQQIVDITKAFMPGGPQYYNFQEHEKQM